MCNLPSGGVPTTYLSSQQTGQQRTAVLKELCKVNSQLSFLSLPSDDSLLEAAPGRCACQYQDFNQCICRLFHYANNDSFCACGDWTVSLHAPNDIYRGETGLMSQASGASI